MRLHECGTCHKQFATQRARDDHRHMKCGGRRSKRQPNGPPMAGMTPDDVYDFVDAMDLPDGAHWAMIEELSGYEPGDFA